MLLMLAALGSVTLSAMILWSVSPSSISSSDLCSVFVLDTKRGGRKSLGVRSEEHLQVEGVFLTNKKISSETSGLRS